MNHRRWVRWISTVIFVLAFTIIVEPSYTFALDNNVESALKKDGQSQTPANPVVNLDGSSGSIVGSMFELFLALGIIIFVIYFLIRFLATKTNLTKQHPLVQTVAVQMIAQNRSVQLVALDDRILVLGVGEDITLLYVIDDIEEVERLKLSVPTVLSTQGDWLNKWIPRPNRNLEKSSESSFSATLQEKMNQIRSQRKSIRDKDSES